jgi:hypothetical protein
LKTFLFSTFALCFALSVVVALSQDAPNQAPKTPAELGAQLTTVMGTVQDGEKLRFVTEQRAWKVDNPEASRVTKDTTSTQKLTSTRTRI